MPSAQEMPILVTIRAKDRISGTSNDFEALMPITLPAYTQYWKVRVVCANLPYPASDENLANPTHRYVTGGVELRMDLGGRTHSFDTSRNAFHSMGFLTSDSTGALGGHNKSLSQHGEFPTHIVTNPNYSTIRTQLFDSSGDPLLQLQISGSSLSQPEEIHLTLEFSPLL